MRTRFQHGDVQLTHRSLGPDVWVYRWREDVPGGVIKRRAKMIGTIEQYPNKKSAQLAAEHLRLAANQGHPCSRVYTFGALIDRYVAEELPSRFSTRQAYLAYLNTHIKPRWKDVSIANVKPLAVRQWLRSLPLATRSKGHIRSLMAILFDCAMLWELLDTQRNPMELVHVEGTTKREKEPRILTVEEFQSLLKQIDEEPFYTMVLTGMCLGLRCSELLALKWSDFDWIDSTVLVQRAIVAGRVDKVKTKYSRTRVPLDPNLAKVLLNWRSRTEFNKSDDWVFASPFKAGQAPFSSWGVQQRRIKPAGLRAGLGPIGWHTLRHYAESRNMPNAAASSIDCTYLQIIDSA